MITLRGRRPRHYLAASTSRADNNLDPALNVVGALPVEGDWILAVLTSGTPIASTQKPVLPPGWVWLLPPTQPGSGSGTFAIAAHQRLAGETSYQWGVTATASETNGLSLEMLWGSGAGDARNWKPGATWARLGANTAIVRQPSVLTTRAPSTVLAFAFDRTVATETEAQVTTGWEGASRFQFSVMGDQTYNIMQKDFATSGTATGDAVTTYPNPHAQNGLGIQIETTAVPAVAPVEPPPAPVELGLAVRVVGQPGTMRLKVSNGAGLITPKAQKVVPAGYSSVTNMLSQEFYIAHRGGSRDYPEMSLYGYGQSTLKGYGALELSLARTSDGVWFGLHDSSIDRTSGIVTGKQASQMTWAEVQAQPILASITSNVNQPNRPYMRWEDLMGMYYNSHVIFVDPKASMPFRLELLNMMDSMPGNPHERFVGKFFGVLGGSPEQADSFPKQLRDRGYQSWGFFYEADLANLPAYADRWTILGMDYGAPQSAWDTILAYGKPVIGHITPGQSAVATARSKGADGYMVSGTRDIVPNPIIR